VDPRRSCPLIAECLGRERIDGGLPIAELFEQLPTHGGFQIAAGPSDQPITQLQLFVQLSADDCVVELSFFPEDCRGSLREILLHLDAIASSAGCDRYYIRMESVSFNSIWPPPTSPEIVATSVDIRARLESGR
jgi:hypothetical protein